MGQRVAKLGRQLAVADLPSPALVGAAPFCAATSNGARRRRRRKEEVANKQQITTKR